MVNKIAFFVFIMSILIVVKYMIIFLLNFISTEPKPLKLNHKEEILLLFSVSYLITFIFE